MTLWVVYSVTAQQRGMQMQGEEQKQRERGGGGGAGEKELEAPAPAISSQRRHAVRPYFGVLWLDKRVVNAVA